MGITIKENQEVAVMEEVTEGTYIAPASGTDYVQVLSDGLEVTPAKEQLDRAIMDGSIGRLTPRQGTSSVSGSVGVELKASGTEGAAPESAPLYKSAMGAERTFVTKTVDDLDSGGTHTASKAYLSDGDGAAFEVGDVVTFKVAGAYHTTPITTVGTAIGDNFIETLVANPSGAYTDTTVITAGATYFTANTGHPSLSVSKYVEGAVLESGSGCRPSSMSLNNFSTGQLADVSFGFEGMSFDRSVTSSPFTPSFDAAFPAVILKACVYMDGTLIDVNDVSVSLENTIAWKTTTCSENGRVAGRVSNRVMSGSFTPYKQDDSVDMFTKFDNSTEFSVFLTAHVPTGVAGEYDQVCSFYLPNCVITELAESDADGLLQNAVSFAATRGSTGSEEECYVTFS